MECEMPKKVTLQEFIERANQAHNFKFDYSLVSFDSVHDKVKIICPKHSVFEQKVNDHMRGVGCRFCFGFLGTQSFIEKAVALYGDKYSYEKTEYTGITNKVKVICPIHGEFEQIARTHLRTGGCRECGNKFKHGHKRNKYIESCKEKYSGLSRLYVIKCFDETEVFYKVGITTKEHLKLRFSGVHMPYAWEEIFLHVDDCAYIWDIETQIHDLLSEHTYKPLKRFNGHTECFTHIPKQVIKLLDEIKSSNQLQLIA